MTVENFISSLENGEIIALVDVPKENEFGSVLPEHNEVRVHRERQQKIKLHC